VNYTCDFLWLGHCRGDLATSLRLRGAALKAFVEVGTSAAVRAVLQRALQSDASGLQRELGGGAVVTDLTPLSAAIGGLREELQLALRKRDEDLQLALTMRDEHLQTVLVDVHAGMQQVQEGLWQRLLGFLRGYGETVSARTASFAQRLMLGGLRQSMQEVVTEARASGLIEITRQGTTDRQERQQAQLLRLCKQLPAGEEAHEALQDDGHLPVSAFLEEHLAAREQYVVAHYMPKFAEELKRRKLAQAEALGERPWIARSVGAWRIQYTERDRALMEALLNEREWQETLQRQLARHKPAEEGQGARGDAAGGFRPGPQSGGRRPAQGSSANVNPESIGSFFKASAKVSQ
jgi:hypothetical protein